MWEVCIDNHTILYTGDYSDDEEMIIPPYQLPPRYLHPGHLDMLIMECTYGNAEFKSIHARQDELFSTIITTIRQGGRVLIPCHAVGFTQELIALIQRALGAAGLRAPLYCASSDTLSLLPLYRQFALWLGDEYEDRHSSSSQSVQLQDHNHHHQQQQQPSKSLQLEGVQQFRVDYLNTITTPFILFAPSPSMTAGVAKTAFEKLASDAKSTIIFLGHNSNESFIGQMMKDHAKLPSGTPVQCKRVTIPFSAHPDRKSNVRLIERCQPGCVVLVHGDKNSCAGFVKHYLQTHEEKPLMLMPENGKQIRYTPERYRVSVKIPQAMQLQCDYREMKGIDGIDGIDENGMKYLVQCNEWEEKSGGRKRMYVDVKKNEGDDGIPLWTGIRRKCSKEQVNEIKHRLEAKSEGIRVQLRNEDELEIAWKEGYEKEADTLIALIHE